MERCPAGGIVPPDEAQKGVPMLKRRALFGVVVAACALGATTTMVSAATHHKKAPPPPPASISSGPPASLKCGKGTLPVLHTMGTLSWSCVKPS